MLTVMFVMSYAHFRGVFAFSTPGEGRGKAGAGDPRPAVGASRRGSGGGGVQAHQVLPRSLGYRHEGTGRIQRPVLRHPLWIGAHVSPPQHFRGPRLETAKGAKPAASAWRTRPSRRRS